MTHLIELVYKEWLEVIITKNNIQYKGQVFRGICYFVEEILVYERKINIEQSEIILRFLRKKAAQLLGIKKYDTYWFPVYDIGLVVTPEESYRYRKEFLEKILKK